MMQKILSPREKVIFYLTGGVAVFALLFNFFLAPSLSRLDTLNRQIALAQAKLYKYARLLSEKNYLVSRYAKFSARPKGSVPGQMSAVDWLSELENIAKASGIKIVDLRPRAASGARNETLIDMRTMGPVEGYFNFIYNLENSLSLLQIKSFQLLSRPNTTDLEGNFSITKFLPAEK